MTLRTPGLLCYVLLAVASTPIVACGGDDDNSGSDAAVDAETDGSSAGDVASDTGAEPDATDAGSDASADADTANPDDAEPDDTEPTPDTIDSDVPVVPAVCGDGVQEGDELCDDDNEDDTDGCLADCRTTTQVSGAVRLDDFPVAGVTVTATLDDETWTATTSETDGTYVLYLPAGEWVMEATLAEFVIVTDDATLVSDGSGDTETDFALISSTVPIEADAYGTSSLDAPATLPSGQALQFRTFDTPGDGDWFVVDTAETGRIGLFAANLGVNTDTLFLIYDATTFDPDGDNIALNNALGYGTEDDDVYRESMVVLPLNGTEITEYVVHVRPYDSPCAFGSYFLGTASGDLLLDADEDTVYALKDCDDTAFSINPSFGEDSRNDLDDNCDGYIAPATYTDLGLGNTSRETAHELVLSDPYFSGEVYVLEDRLSELTLDSYEGVETRWYVVTVPPSGLVKYESKPFFADCRSGATLYWDDEVNALPPVAGLIFRNDTESPRRLFAEVTSNQAEADGDTPAAWCILAPLILDLGLDTDNDGIGTIGVGGRRDLDDADNAVGACNAAP